MIYVLSAFLAVQAAAANVPASLNAAGSAPTASPATRADASAQVAALVAQLDAEDFRQRIAAREQLIQIGGPAVSALLAVVREPGADQNPERVVGARVVLAEIAARAAAERDTLRPKAYIALHDQNFATAFDIYQRLALARDGAPEDRLGLAGALEGLHRWRAALDAYRTGIAAIDARLLAEPALPPAEQRIEQGPVGRRGPVLTLETVRAQLEREKAALRPRRLQALLAMGRIQRDHLDEPETARKSFRVVVDELPALADRPLREMQTALLKMYKDQTPDGLLGPAELSERIPYRELLRLRIEALKELAATDEAAGKIEPALDALSRVALAEALIGGNATYVEVKPMWQTLRKLAPGAAVPELPFLHVLAPARAFKVQPLTPQSQATAAFWQYAQGGMRAYRYFLTAPPGMRFESLQLSVEIERKDDAHQGFGVRFVGLRDGAFIDAGEAPLNKRVTLKKTFELTPDQGAQLLHLEVMDTADPQLVIHSVQVQGTLKKAVPDAQAPGVP